MKTFHINHDSTRLLIFFCGFYTDADCFIEFDNNSSDILFVYDYSDFDVSELNYFDFSPYVEINLIAYSYGVFATNAVYDFLPALDKKIAISGTIFPIDDNFGIPLKIYDIMLNSFSLDVIKNFKAKMQKNSNGEIKDSKRSLESLKNELISIKNYVLNNKIEENLEFDTVILTKKDRIIPYSAQSAFYSDHHNKIVIDCGHFPFFEFNNFDEILEL